MAISDKTTLLVVSKADLREFALTIIDEVRNLPTTREPMYSPGDFAKRHGVNITTLWRWRKLGLLQGIKMGGKIWYRDSDLKGGNMKGGGYEQK